MEFLNFLLQIILGVIVAPAIYAIVLKFKPEIIAGPLVKFLSLFITDKDWTNKISNAIGIAFLNIGRHIITYQEDDKETEKLMDSLADIVTELLILQKGGVNDERI